MNALQKNKIVPGLIIKFEVFRVDAVVDRRHVIELRAVAALRVADANEGRPAEIIVHFVLGWHERLVERAVQSSDHR